MVSKEAEERRLRFQAAKDAAGGLVGLIKQELSKKPKVYFLNDGTIVSISKEDIDLKEGWQVKEFEDEQLNIINDNNWQTFYIKTDPLVDNLYSIETRPLENVVVSAENNSLMLVNVSGSKHYDCKCKLTKTTFIVELSLETKSKYTNVEPANATANGFKVLKFYFTAPNDPHIMIHSEYIALKSLLENKVTINTPLDLTQTSIYTVKAFDKYVRT